jgi:ABC-type multidrug transport system ATPase subunit
MNENELVCDMYSHLNLIINELNSIGLTKLGDADIVRKIISMLPKKKYASIITILHNMEDLSTMTRAIVIGKIVAFEMLRKMGQKEASSSSKCKALACSEKKKMKGSKLRQVQAQAPQVKMKKMRMMMMMNQVMMINLPPPPPKLMKNHSRSIRRWRR